MESKRGDLSEIFRKVNIGTATNPHLIKMKAITPEVQREIEKNIGNHRLFQYPIRIKLPQYKAEE